MKKTSIFLILVVLMSSWYHPIGAATHHVFPGPGNPIQTALTNASAGDTIVVHPGVYTGQITVTKNDVTLQSSDGAAATLIDFTGVWCGYWSTGVGGVDIPYGVSGVIIEGFTIVGGSPASDALVSIGGDNNLIRNNIIIGDPLSGGQDIGIHIGDVAETSERLPSGNRIVSNDVYDHAGSGIFIGNWAGTNIIVSGNTVYNNVIGGIPGLNGNGIEVDRALGVVIKNNTVYNNEAAGIKVVRTAPDAVITISGNTITGNGTGVTSEQWRPGATTSAVVLVTCNNIATNTFGMRNTVQAIINARTNWWGDITGPHHPLLNPGGTGNDVSDNVDFIPWGLVPNPCAQPLQWGTPPTVGKNICPLANHNLREAEALLETVEALLDDVHTQELDLDTSQVEELLEKAAALLEKAKIFCRNSQNCIAGNNLAIEAQNLLKEAQELLMSMLQ